ncbi:uncharacterized protein [Henckelia pumila]|uniref:uncharacterized protein n=1 Tax=Henckelia pumila TaxID=405737 RepID=UPI003C6E62C3
MARLYVQEFVCLHGILLSIVSDRDPSIDMAPFKALYGRRCRTPLFWDEVGERQVEGPQMIQQMTDAVEMIRKRIKYVADESHILHPTEVQLDQDLSYVERPLRIFDRKDKVLRNKSIPLMKVQWQRRGTEKATWELERRM